MKNLSDRIAIVKKETGWTNTEIARRAKVTRSAVTDWLNGRVVDLSASSAQNLSANSKYSATWLATGDGPKLKTKEFSYVNSTNKKLYLSVIGVAQLGENGWYDEVIKDTEGYIEYYSNDSEAYVLRIKGDSMFPAIRNGWYMVVEPNGAICNGEYVALKLKDGRRLVKELLFRHSDSLVLQSANGSQRLTIEKKDIEQIYPVAAIVPPSKHKHLID